MRRKPLLILLGIVLVAAIITIAVLVVVGAADRRRAADPRSPLPTGSGALGQLLSDQGVQVSTVDRASEALRAAGPDATLVVTRISELSEQEATELRQAGFSRIVLLRPNSIELKIFGVPVNGESPSSGKLDPGCSLTDTTLAGAIELNDAKAFYTPLGPALFTCYGAPGGGYAYAAVEKEGVPIQLLAGGIDNRSLTSSGNAALAMNVLGAQQRLVWLMATRTEAVANDETDPGLLPPWWQIGVVQAALALAVVGVWRGRRLGPILTERLPVRVRAAETVEGHGRLYYRLGALDQAAHWLRVGARERLGRAFGSAGSGSPPGRPGSAEDELALSASVAQRTGRDAGTVRMILFGPQPTNDDQLAILAKDLHQLEQEARQL